MRVYIFLIYLLIFKVNNLQCGNKEIDHCVECNIRIDKNSCKRCEEKHFLFFDNSLCIPCNDSTYSQFGNFQCNGVCEEGYYNLNNICRPCSDGLENCGKCTYELSSSEISSDINSKYFNCTECLSNQYKLINISNDQICFECFTPNCIQCHYENDVPICENCDIGYYIKDN